MRSGGTPIRLVVLAGALAVSASARADDPAPFPVRGLHVSAPKPGEMTEALRFVREALPKEGVNLLVVEFGYRFQFSKHPEVVDPEALSRDDVRALVDGCRAAGVRLIPAINLLGHQSWARTTHGLLRSHPEFDETPGRYPENQGIYCRSYCPLHPSVHAVVFDLIDELAEACQADAFHVGMDEVFLLGEDDCPRCKGRSKAELFAGEVRALHDHLAESRRTMWMWGDRFLDAEVTGIGKWEASLNGTSTALGMAPRDIVICDWHYTAAPPTPYVLRGRGLSGRRRAVAAGGGRSLATRADPSCAQELERRDSRAHARGAADVVVRDGCFREGLLRRDAGRSQRDRGGRVLQGAFRRPAQIRLPLTGSHASFVPFTGCAASSPSIEASTISRALRGSWADPSVRYSSQILQPDTPAGR